MNWTEAVRLAGEGKDEGYEFLYMQTYQKNYYVALRYMKQEDAANDVLQDAYIKAFANLDQLQDADKFPGWMARIVTTTALDELKKRKVMLFSQIQTEDEEVSMEELLEDERTDTQPELAVDQKETQRLVQEMIDTLSDEQKLCIMMFYIEELSVKEIAQTLAVSENTVKSRLKYGRKNIEEKALELEKKGTKLYGLAPFPFFLYLLHQDVMSVQASPAPFSTILKKKAAAVGGRAGRSAFAKMSAVSVKKAVIGVVLGLTVCGGTVAVIHSVKANPIAEQTTTGEARTDDTLTDDTQADDVLTDDAKNIADMLSEETGNEVFADEEVSTEEEITETDIQDALEQEAEAESAGNEWKEAYIDFADSLQGDENGYAVLEVAGSDVPILVVMPEVFDQKEIITEDSCTYAGCYWVEFYYFDTTAEEVRKVFSAESDDPDGALVSFYMEEEMGFYLTYLPDEQLLVGDLVGSSAVIETYSLNSETGNLRAVESYVDEKTETVDRKDVIYYRTVEQALENTGSVRE